MDKKEFSQEPYTREQVKDAENFLAQLRKIPLKDMEAGQLLTLGFMNGLEAAGMTAAR